MTEATEGDGVIDLGSDGPAEITSRVDDLTARIKKVQTTDEGKLQVALEAEGLDDDALAQVKEMLSLQQATVVKVAMRPVQRDMFESEPVPEEQDPSAQPATAEPETVGA